MIIRKIIFVPFRRLLYAMKRIENGDIDFRIENYPASDEFQFINTAFNKMIDHINNLKIYIYEEKISKQKMELQHLQLQINPHFYLNSLNTIYTLARTQNYKVIQELSMYLIEYFRFMFRSNINFVSLKDEINNVKNYIYIQKLRFPNSFSYEIETPEFLEDVPVPTFLIYTFVENTFKHAVNRDYPVRLSVRTELVEGSGQKPFIKLTVKDTGIGFKEEVLNKLRQGECIIDEHREHIGIWNIQQRLQLLYKGQAKISFSNGITNGGAMIEINFPMNNDVLNVGGAR